MVIQNSTYKAQDYNAGDRQETQQNIMDTISQTKISLPAQKMLQYVNMAADMMEGGFSEQQVYDLLKATDLRESQSQKGTLTVDSTPLGEAKIRHFEYGQSTKLASAFALSEYRKSTEEQLEQKAVKYSGLGKVAAAGILLPIAGLTALVASESTGYTDTIPVSGSVNNGEIQYDFAFDMNNGEATVAISNIGTTPMTQFDLPITELIGYEADPDNWSLNPGSGTANFAITGDSLISGGSFLIDYTFDKDKVELAFDNLDYSGPAGSGTLDNIVTTHEIPEPATLGLLFAGAVVGLAKKRRK